MCTYFICPDADAMVREAEYLWISHDRHIVLHYIKEDDVMSKFSCFSIIYYHTERQGSTLIDGSPAPTSEVRTAAMLVLLMAGN
jgi:hypothetical protein